MNRHNIEPVRLTRAGSHNVFVRLLVIVSSLHSGSSWESVVCLQISSLRKGHGKSGAPFTTGNFAFPATRSLAARAARAARCSLDTRTGYSARVPGSAGAG